MEGFVVPDVLPAGMPKTIAYLYYVGIAVILLMMFYRQTINGWRIRESAAQLKPNSGKTVADKASKAAEESEMTNKLLETMKNRQAKIERWQRRARGDITKVKNSVGQFAETQNAFIEKQEIKFARFVTHAAAQDLNVSKLLEEEQRQLEEYRRKHAHLPEESFMGYVAGHQPNHAPHERPNPEEH
jgi:hypothetical protein